MTEYKILTEEDPQWVEDKMNELAQLGFTLKEFTTTFTASGELDREALIRYNQLKCIGVEQKIIYTAVMMRHDPLDT